MGRESFWFVWQYLPEVVFIGVWEEVGGKMMSLLLLQCGSVSFGALEEDF